MHASNILVLESGKLVCQGTHDQLMDDCSVYQEIASSQLSAEELSAGSKPGAELQRGMS